MNICKSIYSLRRGYVNSRTVERWSLSQRGVFRWAWGFQSRSLPAIRVWNKTRSRCHYIPRWLSLWWWKGTFIVIQWVWVITWLAANLPRCPSRRDHSGMSYREIAFAYPVLILFSRWTSWTFFGLLTSKQMTWISETLVSQSYTKTLFL